MRNDVKFGLTIGGLLVFIMVIWVAVVKRDKASSNHSDIARTDTSSGITSSDGESGSQSNNGSGTATSNPPIVSVPNPPVTPAPQPAPVGKQTVPPMVADNGSNPAPNSNTSDQAAGNGPQHDWSALLNDGRDTASAPIIPAISRGNDAGAGGSSGAASGSSAQGYEQTSADNRADVLVNPHVNGVGAPTTQPLTARPFIGGRTHTVQQGETLSTIAAAVYGSSKYYHRLIVANPQVNPNRLKVGQVIQIPPAPSGSATPATTTHRHTDATVTGNSRSSAAKSSGDTAGSDTQASIDPAKSYRVGPGDTLVRIARKLYHHDQDWERIYEANRDAIGANPGRLKLGMILRLPEAPTVASAQ